MLGWLTAEMVVIGLARVAGSLPVLRWPLAGAIIAILTDLSDLFLMNLLDLGGLGDYQRFDKIMDQVYLATFLTVALRWRGVERPLALGLYLFRLAGFFLFEATQARWLLPLFPNLFEFWFVYVAASRHRNPKHVFGRRELALSLPLLLLAKEGQEYVIHGARLLDSFTAVEAVQAIGRWLIAPFR